MSELPPHALDCATVAERLVSGERPGNEAALAEHVGSCLGCFRTANDLKSLPQLRRQMLEAADQLPDPGAAFWANFPAEVTAAWQPTAAGEAPVSRRRSWDVVLQDFGAWLRRPVPAAMGGALAAAAIILVALSPRERGDGPGSPTAIVSGEAPTLGQGSNLVPGGVLDDQLGELDIASLETLQAGLERTFSDDFRGRTLGETDEGAASQAASLSDELEELNVAGLAALSANLEERGSSQ